MSRPARRFAHLLAIGCMPAFGGGCLPGPEAESEITEPWRGVPVTYEPAPGENPEKGQRAWDIFSRLLKDRIVFVGTHIDDNVASVLIAQLLFLDADSPGEPIRLYINSPGGVVTASLAIYDTMQFLRSPVHTYCLRQSYGMATLLLASGAPGERYVVRGATVGVGRPRGAMQETNPITRSEIARLTEKLSSLYQLHTGRPMSAQPREGLWFSGEETVEGGLVDEILERAPDEPAQMQS